MKVIGLTGGIASGKSSVAKTLEMLGAVVVDADQLAREIVTPGKPAYIAIIAEFGEQILNPDQTINRTALGKLVFADAVARKRLERITHPAIGSRAANKLAELQQAGAQMVFYMAPLLIEAGITSRVDEIWVVNVDQETQLQRLMQRDLISREEALQRLAAQMPMAEKIKYGKVVIDNSGTLDETERQVREAWEKLVQSSKFKVQS